jgi:hypothetical protein
VILLPMRLLTEQLLVGCVLTVKLIRELNAKDRFGGQM